MNQPLILLFGMPRSGTTWLGKIFDSHPDTLYRHEPDSHGTLNTLPLFAYANDAENYRIFLQTYIENLALVREEKVSASLPIFAKSYYSPFQLMLRKMLVYGTKIASRIFCKLHVPSMVNVKLYPQIKMVWKSIESLGRLGVLAQVFPDARCVVIFRHPCGYVASVLRGEANRKFEGGTPSSEDWGVYQLLLNTPVAKEHRLELHTVQSMTAVERLALKWALCYEHALAETARMKNVTTVRYEDFCEHPQEETRKIFYHCGLSWAKETEHFIANSTASENAKYYSVFKNPVVAAWKWKNELAASDIEQIMGVVRQFKSGAQYPTA